MATADRDEQGQMMNEWRAVKLGNLDSLEIGLLQSAIESGRIIDGVTPRLKRTYRRYCQQTGREYREIDAAARLGIRDIDAMRAEIDREVRRLGVDDMDTLRAVVDSVIRRYVSFLLRNAID